MPDGGATPSADLSVRDLAKSFGGVDVFAGVSFGIAPGAQVALVGANGTGKSTLLRCCLGLIKPTAGGIEMLGQDLVGISRRDLRAVRGQTGLVSQKPNLSPRLSVLSNVLHGMLGRRSGPRIWMQAFAPADLRERAMAALDRVGLADLALRRADRLSGGQAQRVAIARALVSKPRLIVADEPCAALDPAAGEDVMALFIDLARAEGVTVIFTSHNLRHALDYGERVLGLRDKRLALDRPADGLSAEELRGLYD